MKTQKVRAGCRRPGQASQSHAKAVGTTCMVALSHPCGETASVRADRSAMAAILIQPNEPSASYGDAATARARATADARPTAAEPSRLRVAGTAARENTR